MSPAPDTIAQIVETPAAPKTNTDTGQCFVAVLAEKGPLLAAGTSVIRSDAQYKRVFGGRSGANQVYADGVEAFFAIGGTTLNVSRVVGPAAVAASRDLLNASSTATLRVAAKTVGEHGNDLRVQVLAGSVGGTFALVVSTAAAGELERSGDLLDEAAAVTWGEASSYVTVSDLAGTGDPAVAAAANLTGGTDDRASVTDTHHGAALSRFGKALGPGQVAMPGRTTTAAHAQLGAHAVERNRVDLPDLPDSASKATVKAAALAARAATGARRGFAASSWALGPGLVGGTTRDIPWSMVQAALIAIRDRFDGPNTPAAADNGQPSWIVGVKNEFEDDRDELSDAGVNVVRVIGGRIQVYDYVSLADPALDPKWVPFSNVRYFMGLQARGEAKLRKYVLKKIDGKGRTLGKAAGDLIALLERDRVDEEIFEMDAENDLGLPPDPGYSVDLGPDVNTLESLQARQIRAQVKVRPAPFAGLVSLDLFNVSLTDQIEGV